MKILVIPMAAIAETAGPSSRCKVIAEAFQNAGVETATCMSLDVNYRKIEGIQNYFLDTPMPLGLPKFIATKTFPLAQKLGITKRKQVDSFDQVLWFTGNLDYRYLKRSIKSIQKAIKVFEPDIVYSEFNISALIAARLENKRLFTTVSYPTQPEYGNNPKLANGLNQLLSELRLPKVKTALDLFTWADECFCPSIRMLEPINRKNVTFCGSWKKVEMTSDLQKRIMAYMGNGAISAKSMVKEIEKAFIGSDYDVYIASKSLEESTHQNIRIAKYWDFDELLTGAELFINHGGQNSIIDGLIHGVPQLIVPGKVFERCYNAKSVVSNNAGILISDKEFQANIIRRESEKILQSASYRKNAVNLGLELISQGGVEKIITCAKTAN